MFFATLFREGDLLCGSLDRGFSGDEAGINRAVSLPMAIGNDASPGLTPEAWPCCMSIKRLLSLSFPACF